MRAGPKAKLQQQNRICSFLHSVVKSCHSSHCKNCNRMKTTTDSVLFSFDRFQRFLDLHVTCHFVGIPYMPQNEAAQSRSSRGAQVKVAHYRPSLPSHFNTSALARIGQLNLDYCCAQSNNRFFVQIESLMSSRILSNRFWSRQNNDNTPDRESVEKTSDRTSCQKRNFRK